MKTFKFLFALIFFILAISCSKQDEILVLPTGENTVHYYINGKLEIPAGFQSGTIYVNPILSFKCDLSNSAMQLLFTSNSKRSLKLFFKNGIQTIGSQTIGTGIFNDCINTTNFISFRDSNYFSDYVYFSNNSSSEIIITKISSDKRMFTGTFTATLYEANGQTVEITGGVFDINLDTL